jgi:hypothetical protein
MIHKLITIWSFLRHHLNHKTQQVPKVRRKMLRNFRQYPLENFLIESLHIFSLKWWLESNHLINDAPKTPDITFDIIGLIFPNLRRGIVRRPCLSIVESFWVGNLRHIHISKFSGHVVVQENVGTLQVSVHDLYFVHCLEAPHWLYEDLPNLTFFNISFIFFMLTDFLENVSVVS